MLTFTKNDILKIKGTAHYCVNNAYQALNYFTKCEKDDYVERVKGYIYRYNQQYEKAAEIHKELYLSGSILDVIFYIQIMYENLNKHREAYDLLTKGVEENRPAAYFGLAYLWTILTKIEPLLLTSEDEFRGYIESAIEFANEEEKNLIYRMVCRFLPGSNSYEDETKILLYKLKCKGAPLIRTSYENKLWLIREIDIQDEVMLGYIKKEIDEVLFGTVDSVTALIFGLYLLKVEPESRFDFNSEAYKLFEYSYSKDSKHAAPMYALKYGHKSCEDQESLYKAYNILERTKEIKKSDIDALPKSLRNIYVEMIEEIHPSLIVKAKNVYKTIDI